MTFWGNKYMLFIKAQRTTGLCLESQCNCPTFKSKNSKQTLHHMYTLSTNLCWWVQHRPLMCYLEKLSLCCESARRGRWDVHIIWPTELLPGRSKTLVLAVIPLYHFLNRNPPRVLFPVHPYHSQIPQWPSQSNNFFLRSRLFPLLSINFAF